MANRGSARKSADQRLKGNVIVEKKIVLRPYENATVNLMVEFYRDESDHIKEAEKLMNSIDAIIQMIKKKWH